MKAAFDGIGGYETLPPGNFGLGAPRWGRLLLRLGRRAQGFLDRVCGVVNRILPRGRYACFGVAIVQMHSPSPPGWMGGLDDLILDTLVLHAGNNGPREQRFLSGFGLTIQNRPLLRSGYPRHLAHVSCGVVKMRNTRQE